MKYKARSNLWCTLEVMYGLGTFLKRKGFEKFLTRRVVRFSGLATLQPSHPFRTLEPAKWD